MDLVFDATPDDLSVFLQEADELMQQLDENVLRLEKEGQNPEIIQEIFRAAHTLKGSSGMLGHERMAELTHSLESLFDKLRKDELSVTTELIDVFLDCLDALKILKEECITFKASDIDIKTLIIQIDGFASGTPVEAGENGGPVSIVLEDHEHDVINMAEVKGSTAFSIRIKVTDDCMMPSVRFYQVIEEFQPIGEIIKTNPGMDVIENGECGTELVLILVTDEDQSRLESIVKAVSELSEHSVGVYSISSDHDEDEPQKVEETAAVPGDKRVQDLGPDARGKSAQELQQMRTAAAVKTVRVDVERLDHLMNLVGELVIGKTRLQQIGSDLANSYHVGDLTSTLNEVTAHVGQITNELQEEVMRARMLPIEQVFNKFPRLVRDLARTAGKTINFVVEGKETEIDRSVLEEIGDPLVHILRNAIDHGVETPDDRIKAGKSPEGSVFLGARHEENHIVVEVSDDGHGMDVQKIKDKAIRKGFLTQEAGDQMSDREIFDLIFLSGFSTADKVSEISGRGVGMDVVRNNIKKINGTVEIISELGVGTRFVIKLPLTLVIVEALTVVVGDRIYAVPLNTIKEVLRLEDGHIKMVDKKETMLLRGSVLSLLRLSELFSHTSAADRGSEDELHVVVVGYGENRIGLIVDRLLSKMEIMIKALGDYLGLVDGISGATVLGDGRVALVVDPVSLIVKFDAGKKLNVPPVSKGKKSTSKKIA
ncbi:MAG: hypothetical protein A2074_02515 [Candidatus Aquicultor primus]|uniref:Chemotaxis protein CheA n=1 Tax=Candidatus Aquicultor primus TaxID=1797195 RepID=A0A1F2UKZ6_9ACTN|nr:MAG: hypothetical protein A2074_02515 [Candidatus Aquicultor primus]